MTTLPSSHADQQRSPRLRHKGDLLLSTRARGMQRVLSTLGHGVLLLVTSSSALAVLFIFFFIANDARQFFFAPGVSLFERLHEFFTVNRWEPAGSPPVFGALAIFVGSGIVTLGAVCVAVPLGVMAAVCLSDVLPFTLRQIVKPIIEVLAAIPSVAYGFFALVIFAPLLQNHGGMVLAVGWWIVAVPIVTLIVVVLSDVLTDRIVSENTRRGARVAVGLLLGAASLWWIWVISARLYGLEISSGTNALNVSIILGIMAMPTVVSVSEDALQAVGRELREGAYALGATRAEVLTRVVIPAAGSGICAAVILGVMRAIGETMVVWMASGNADQIPEPWYNWLEPVRTLTATIAGDMGEADHVTGSDRYHVLFAMALALLTISFVCNLVSEQVIRRSVTKNA